MKEITNRSDVCFLVDTFYSKVRIDKILGPIFNSAISDWPNHIKHLSDFWESNLFLVNKYKGNPAQKHQEVDVNNNNTIEALHFGIWLNYWFETLDQYFEGEKADLAKNRARKMVSHLFLKIYERRLKD